MYLAYICYPYQYHDDADDLDDLEPDIKFEEPNYHTYSRVVPIAFHPLMSWSEKDAKLFEVK